MFERKITDIGRCRKIFQIIRSVLTTANLLRVQIFLSFSSGQLFVQTWVFVQALVTFFSGKSAVTFVDIRHLFIFIMPDFFIPDHRGVFHFR